MAERRAGHIPWCMGRRGPGQEAACPRDRSGRSAGAARCWPSAQSPGPGTASSSPNTARQGAGRSRCETTNRTAHGTPKDSDAGAHASSARITSGGCGSPGSGHGCCGREGGFAIESETPSGRYGSGEGWARCSGCSAGDAGSACDNCACRPVAGSPGQCRGRRPGPGCQTSIVQACAASGHRSGRTPEADGQADRHQARSPEVGAAIGCPARRSPARRQAGFRQLQRQGSVGGARYPRLHGRDTCHAGSGACSR